VSAERTSGIAGGALAGTPTGTWSIDPMHTSVTFAVRHLMSTVRGRFNDVDGRIVLGEAPSSCRVEATISAASIDTGTPMRDEDLRSPNFFDAARFPTLRFRSGEITEDASGIRMAGELTIRDTTRAVVLDVEFLGHDETGLQGEPRIGFVARTTLRRSEFGVGEGRVEGSKVVVGDRVEVVLDVEAYLEP
jgi:polyisoprenoid-binding protein YceI